MLLPLLALVAVITKKPHALPRAAFIAQFEKLHEGDSMETVRKVLGNPDDVRTKFEAGGYNGTSWAWGTNGHMTLPTLGWVGFDDKNRLDYVKAPLLNGRHLEVYWYRSDLNSKRQKVRRGRNYRFEPRRRGGFVHWNGTELQHLLRLIDRLEYPNSRLDFGAPASLELIRAANLLIPLGEAKAISLLIEYDELVESRVSIFPFEVLRCLYVPMASIGSIPEPAIGKIYPSRPADPRKVPEFPVWFQGDIPISVFAGSILAGVPENVEMDVDIVRKVGTFRSKPLFPANDVFGAVSKAERALWNTGMYAEGNGGLGGSKANLRELMNDTLRSLLPGLLPKGQPIRPLPVRWDSHQQCYVSR